MAVLMPLTLAPFNEVVTLLNDRRFPYPQGLELFLVVRVLACGIHSQTP